MEWISFVSSLILPLDKLETIRHCLASKLFIVSLRKYNFKEVFFLFKYVDICILVLGELVQIIC